MNLFSTGWSLAYGGLAIIDALTRPEGRGGRFAFITLGALAMMLAPGGWGFVLGWGLLNAPAVARLIARSRREARLWGGLYLAWLVVTGGALIAFAWAPSAWGPGAATLLLALVGGLFPFHVCWSDARAALRPSERLFFTAAQPAWLLAAHPSWLAAVQGRPGAPVFAPALFWIAAHAVYRAGQSLGERDFENALESMFAALSASVLLGLAGDRLGRAGAWSEIWVWGLGYYGVMSLYGRLSARFKLGPINGCEGLAQAAPRAQSAFLVFGFIAMGAPCGLGFVGEDLLVHALFDRGVTIAVFYIVSTVLAALGFYRVYNHLFAGTRAESGDIGSRTAFLYGVLVALLVVMGLLPDWWLAKS